MIVALDLLARAKGGEGVKSGPIGLAVILLLCIAAYFLFKSMSKHLKRVRENFPEDEPTAQSRPVQPAQPTPAATPNDEPPDPTPAPPDPESP